MILHFLGVFKDVVQKINTLGKCWHLCNHFQDFSKYATIAKIFVEEFHTSKTEMITDD
jgi:hypothetical protein